MTKASPIAALAEREQLKREISCRADRIPSLPDLVVKLLRMIDSDKTHAGEFERHLAGEPTLIAKMLRVVNSPLYGFSRKVTSVQDCVVVLGMRGLKSLILAANTADYMDRNFECYGYAKSGLWKHSIAVATAARSLAKVAGAPTEVGDSVFLGGLLHDIGKVVMAPYLTERAILLASHGQNTPPGLVAAEIDAMSFCHTEAGALVSTRWGLGQAVTDIVTHHHHPALATEHRREVGLVHIADNLACEERTGMLESTSNETPLDPSALAAVNLSEAKYREARARIAEEMAATRQLFS